MLLHIIAEAEKQQLSHALKVLSETEKQLRMSKNQTTWLTAALLQLSSVGPSLDAKDGNLCLRTVYEQGGDDLRDTPILLVVWDEANFYVHQVHCSGILFLLCQIRMVIFVVRHQQVRV